MQWTPKFQYASRSDVGMRRQNNEDNYTITLCPDNSKWFSRGHMFAVADGMGGHEVGELASKTAIDSLPHVYFKSSHEQAADALHHAIQEANRAVYEIGNRNRDFKRLGTTCSTLIACADGYLIGHVGDSRIYRIRGERIDQLTFDHTVGWEQRLRNRRTDKANQVDAEKYGHVLTRCLGPDPTVRIDIEGPFDYAPGDVFILCSDGLTKYLSDVEIGTYGRCLGPADSVKLLTNLANLRGGADNCTVIAVKITSQGGGTALPMTDQYIPPKETSPLVQPACFIGTVIVGLAAGVLSYFQWAIPAAMCGFLATALLIGGYLAGKKNSNEFDSDDTEGAGDGHSTVFFRPYRTAAIRVTESSIEKLREAVSKLLIVAEEGGWKCDFKTIQKHVSQAEKAKESQKFKQAISEYAQALEILMQKLPRDKRAFHIFSIGSTCKRTHEASKLLNPGTPYLC